MSQVARSLYTAKKRAGEIGHTALYGCTLVNDLLKIFNCFM